jgi:PIN domain nuclease of toxin-antitoxin system
MQLLLDTVAFIRAIRAPELLGKNVRRLLENPANVLDLSTISVVEIAIKTRKGRLDLSAEEVDQALSRLSVRLLPFGWRNAFKILRSASLSSRSLRPPDHRTSTGRGGTCRDDRQNFREVRSTGSVVRKAFGCLRVSSKGSANVTLGSQDLAVLGSGGGA